MPERANMVGEDGRAGWLDRPRHRRICLGFLLALQTVLAVTSLLGDSITFDETSHLTSGLSYWMTGDFRLAPEHPPLPKLWCALPLLFLDHHWVDDPPGWREGDFWKVGLSWFSSAPNRDSLLTAARCMMVGLLLATTWLVHRIVLGMWGGRAALLAATVAALCPTMLAHGRLVTTDLPAALCALLTIERFAALLRGIGPSRVIAAGLALGTFALCKFSWPIVVPVLFVMALARLFQRTALPVGWRCHGLSTEGNPSSARWLLDGRRERMVAMIAVSFALAAIVWIAIWSCYGWRFSPFGSGSTLADPASWNAVMPDTEGVATGGPVVGVVRWMHANRLLPEAYLYGLAYTLKTTGQRQSYFMGEYSDCGWRSYFPMAFLIKTPVATMILVMLGGIALVLRKSVTIENRGLLIGLGVFAFVYALTAVCSSLNIGHRHLLPIYPILFVIAGAAGGLATARAGRLAISGCILLLGLSTLHVHPHYVSYFNELVGGPARGHLYLADSNIDWGQDLKRLAAYAKSHPDENIKLAYFGMAEPAAYGIQADMLPSSIPFGTPAELTAGTYVISVTQWLGVYLPEARPENEEMLGMRMVAVLNELMVSGGHSSLENAWESPTLRHLRSCLLIARLRQFKLDERIGWSMFVYRLSESDVEKLASPGIEWE